MISRVVSQILPLGTLRHKPGDCLTYSMCQDEQRPRRVTQLVVAYFLSYINQSKPTNRMTFKPLRYGLICLSGSLTPVPNLRCRLVEGTNQTGISTPPGRPANKPFLGSQIGVGTTGRTDYLQSACSVTIHLSRPAGANTSVSGSRQATLNSDSSYANWDQLFGSGSV